MMNAAIYRDLKPENFLLESTAPECGLKGCDFGLSVFYRPGQIFTISWDRRTTSRLRCDWNTWNLEINETLKRSRLNMESAVYIMLYKLGR